MAIFNKPDQQANIQTDTTVISGSTVVEGTISSKCAIHIDGTHQGIVDAKSTVVIGKTGAINGNLSANKLTVTGLFEGSADCENVEILAGGTLKGKVISNNLTIDQNCTFEGESLKKAHESDAKGTLSDKTNKPDLPTSIKAS
ncbi:MAG: polymer-forming cytoskeletal protein [Proteobacteria bacterium]|nr:polymer-forming cytoskeletal protein [Pseudomonadota bacterium]